jgi:ribosomal protein L11 methyltransferase
LADASARRWPAIDLDLRPGATRPDGFEDRLALVLDQVEAVAVEEPGETEWRIFFDDPARRERGLAVLREAFNGMVRVEAVDVEDEGWAVKVQAELGPVRAGRFVVTPPWQVPEVAADDLVIVIEPSMGFGTGHHQSTRLCLVALERLAVSGLRAIDAGTGSGVLAIAAARLGAREVLALDNDPDAVRAAQANVAANGVAAIVTCTVGTLEAVDASPADLVLANLTVLLLRRFAGPLADLVRPGATLVTSGFTADQVPLVLDAFPGFLLIARDEEDDWVGLTLRKAR